jgi:hypothetical protein
MELKVRFDQYRFSSIPTNRNFLPTALKAVKKYGLEVSL